MSKLLLADDSITVQRIVELTFAGQGVQVVTVGDGQQAIARIPHERPDIVIADIGMAKASGYEVAAFMKRHPQLAHIPVLLMAGAFETVDQQRAEQVGADGIIVKPFEPYQVVSRVRELLARGPQGAGGPAADDAGDGEPGPPRTEPDRPVARRVTDGTTADNYFDRLDAAFASRTSAPLPEPPAGRGADDSKPVPTVDDVLGQPAAQPFAPVRPAGAMAPPQVGPPDVRATRSPAAAAGIPAGNGRAESQTLMADVFNALLAVEQGASDTVVPVLTRPEMTDQLVDEVVRRAVERLTERPMQDTVARLVLEVVERVVRDEITRLRAKT